MVTVTDDAKRELKRILETRSLADDKALRLAVPPTWTGEGDFGIVIDEAETEGVMVEYEGLPVLLIDTELMEKLESSVLDFKDSPSRFTLDVF